VGGKEGQKGAAPPARGGPRPRSGTGPPADAIKRWRGTCDILELTLTAPSA